MDNRSILDFFDAPEREKVRSQFFDDFYETRRNWAACLGVSRVTIWRWESEIIKMVWVILQDYQCDRTHLDNYQRFILTTIYALKQGFVLGYKANNEKVKEYLKKQQTQLTRQQFDNWIAKYDHQRPTI